MPSILAALYALGDYLGRLLSGLVGYVPTKAD